MESILTEDDIRKNYELGDKVVLDCEQLNLYTIAELSELLAQRSTFTQKFGVFLTKKDTASLQAEPMYPDFADEGEAHFKDGRDATMFDMPLYINREYVEASCFVLFKPAIADS